MKKGTTRIRSSETKAKKALAWNFFDCVVVDKSLTIFSVGQYICHALGYAEEQFRGQPLASFLGSAFLEKLRAAQDRGFLDDHPIEVVNKEGIPVLCKVSGFYFGWISDANDLLILQFRSILGVEPPGSVREDSNEEMDEFVYSTSHGMRGPLATIKGLINLLKIHTQVDEEHAFIVSQMNHFAEQLDDRLHKLIYFAESDKASEFSKEQMSLTDIAEKFRDLELDSRAFPKINFTTHISESSIKVDNAMLVVDLLRNVKTFFSRRCRTNFNLALNAVSYENFVELDMLASDIFLSEECRKRIDRVNIGYTEILNHPEFTDLYSAKKIAIKLQARMKLQVLGESMRAHIIIPAPRSKRTGKAI